MPSSMSSFQITLYLLIAAVAVAVTYAVLLAMQAHGRRHGVAVPAVNPGRYTHRQPLDGSVPSLAEWRRMTTAQQAAVDDAQIEAAVRAEATQQRHTRTAPETRATDEARAAVEQARSDAQSRS